MAYLKNQHFVPKAHFKPFSLNGEANSINIFNIRSRRVINNASVSGQCSKNYFYGKDRNIEKAFNSIEGRYATIIRSLELGDSVFEKGYLRDLRSFMFIQFLRTEQALKRTGQSNREMADVVFRDVDKMERPPLLTKEEIIAISMSIFIEKHDILDDLKMVIVRNNTPYEFYTSDDPAVITNRYHIRENNRTNFGLTNSGAIFVLPLSPDKLFLCYDGFVYTIPGKSGMFVEIDNTEDLDAFNQLQILNSSQNIYFKDPSMGERVSEQYRQWSVHREERRFEINQFVPDDEVPGRYKIGTEVEVSEARETMLVSSQVRFRPTIWPRILKWRNPPRVVKTGTGLGTIRPGTRDFG